MHLGLVHGIGENTGNQEFLNCLCGIAHAVIVIAVGVRNETELPKFKSLGIDTVTGLAIKE